MLRNGQCHILIVKNSCIGIERHKFFRHALKQVTQRPFYNVTSEFLFHAPSITTQSSHFAYCTLSNVLILL